MTGALDPTETTGVSCNKGVGTKVCLGPWLLRPGEEKKTVKTLNLTTNTSYKSAKVQGRGWYKFPIFILCVLRTLE